MKNGFRYILLFVLVAAIMIFMLVGGSSLALQRGAKTALEDSVNSGSELSVGEYVSYEVCYVFGPFAHETSTSFFNTMKLSTKESGYFYFLMLEDNTLMVINTANKEEIAAFDRISETLLSAQEFIADGETRKVNGRLRELSNEELKKIYQEGVRETFGVSPDDPVVRYLILDTSAGREWVFYVGFALLIAVIAGFIIAGQLKGKKKTIPME